MTDHRHVKSPCPVACAPHEEVKRAPSVLTRVTWRRVTTKGAGGWAPEGSSLKRARSGVAGRTASTSKEPRRQERQARRAVEAALSEALTRSGQRLVRTLFRYPLYFFSTLPPTSRRVAFLLLLSRACRISSSTSFFPSPFSSLSPAAASRRHPLHQEPSSARVCIPEGVPTTPAIRGHSRSVASLPPRQVQEGSQFEGHWSPTALICCRFRLFLEDHRPRPVLSICVSLRRPKASPLEDLKWPAGGQYGAHRPLPGARCVSCSPPAYIRLLTSPPCLSHCLLEGAAALLFLLCEVSDEVAVALLTV